MSAIFNYILEKTKLIYGLGIGLVGVLSYFFARKTARLEEENETLKASLEEQNSDARKIITIQKKQTIIASEPDVSPDDIDKWLHDRANSTSKES
jgi:hypothetical protein